MSWKCKLQENYTDFEEFQSYSDTYDLSKRLGFDNTRQAWDTNPTIEGSTNPSDFKISTPKKLKGKDE